LYASPLLHEVLDLPHDLVIPTRDALLPHVQVHPDDREIPLKAMADHLAGVTPRLDIEWRLVLRGSGEIRWIHTRATCFRDADGTPSRVAGATYDVSERKRAEQALRESEDRFQLAVTGVNQGVWDWNLETDMVFMSARAQRLFGHEPSEPLRPRREWVSGAKYHPDDVSRIRSAVSSYLRGDARTFSVEYRARLPSGGWRWFYDRGVALRDDRGRPYRMAGSVEDITDRKNAEAERDRLESQLRQSQKLEAMGTLAGGVAHDFNNILAAILGYGEMAQRDARDGTAIRRHIDAAMSAGMRAKALVERILAFSRSGMGERVPVNVQSVVSEALESIAASLPPEVRLVRRLQAGDAAVQGDPTQLHQVVMNLCTNAVQAISSAGVVSVYVETVKLAEERSLTTSTLAPGNYIRLQVADTGTGIAPQVIERIFDPFFTTKELGVGTGLGLSLVHGIVSDLCGGIDIQSEVGFGSTFSVYLPCQGSIAEAAVAEEPVVNGAGQTILLVDDESMLVELGEEMLADLGYEPVGFTSSLAALESFSAAPERFDAVLSDEAMPSMTGSELAIEIRKLRADIPIVLMSGYATPVLSARARDAGVREVLAKPLVSRDIARSLASALRR
jgi:PAS domain S-box-containing protein